jgi:hypothetical protein
LHIGMHMQNNFYNAYLSIGQQVSCLRIHFTWNLLTLWHNRQSCKSSYKYVTGFYWDWNAANICIWTDVDVCTLNEGHCNLLD